MKLTHWRLNVLMPRMKRATIYFEEDLHKALKIKAAEASTSVSDLINEVVKEAFSEDLDDLQAFRDRANEPTTDFESFLQRLKADGKI
jgi:hypothetical protein